MKRELLTFLTPVSLVLPLHLLVFLLSVLLPPPHFLCHVSAHFPSSSSPAFPTLPLAPLSLLSAISPPVSLSLVALVTPPSVQLSLSPMNISGQSSSFPHHLLSFIFRLVFWLPSFSLQQPLPRSLTISSLDCLCSSSASPYFHLLVSPLPNPHPSLAKPPSPFIFPSFFSYQQTLLYEFGLKHTSKCPCCYVCTHI